MRDLNLYLNALIHAVLDKEIKLDVLRKRWAMLSRGEESEKENRKSVYSV